MAAFLRGHGNAAIGEVRGSGEGAAMSGVSSSERPGTTNGIHPVCGRAAAAGVSLRTSPVLLTLQITVIWGMTKNPCICTGCSLRPETPWKGKKWGPVPLIYGVQPSASALFPQQKGSGE